MLFHTPEFFWLLVLVFPLYWALPRYRLYLLALADLAFYAWSGLGQLALFLVITFFVYWCGKKYAESGKGYFITAGILVAVANLLFYKYALFILHNLEYVTGWQLVGKSSLLQQLVLPLGISFYTFHLVAYLGDLKRKWIEPAGSWLEFWIFVSFFGQLVAGPIMRGEDFLPQIARTRQLRFDSNLAKAGVFLIVLGLVKKIMIADYVAGQVNQSFAGLSQLTAVKAWLGAYLFGFQIYADFSGYSDIALGLGLLFGYRLTQNFAAPYLSQNFTEFWRRWHISLSRWIRDYIYIPLGGSRKGRVRTYLNLFIAMLVSGIWHGAAWNFIAWGAIHGLYLLGHKLYLKLRPPAWGERGWLGRAIAVFITFNLTTIAWVFFRAQSLPQALAYLARMFQPINGLEIKTEQGTILLVLLLFTAHVIEAMIRGRADRWQARWSLVPAPVRGMAYALIVIWLLYLLPGEKLQFIYFQF